MRTLSLIKAALLSRPQSSDSPHRSHIVNRGDISPKGAKLGWGGWRLLDSSMVCGPHAEPYPANSYSLVLKSLVGFSWVSNRQQWHWARGRYTKHVHNIRTMKLCWGDGCAWSTFDVLLDLCHVYKCGHFNYVRILPEDFLRLRIDASQMLNSLVFESHALLLEPQLHMC